MVHFLLSRSYFFRDEHSAFHAFSVGAVITIPIAVSIAVNLIGFVALLEFINGTLQWVGDRVRVEELSFQVRASLQCLTYSIYFTVCSSSVCKFLSAINSEIPVHAIIIQSDVDR